MERYITTKYATVVSHLMVFKDLHQRDILIDLISTDISLNTETSLHHKLISIIIKLFMDIKKVAVVI